SNYHRRAVFAAPLTGIPNDKYELTTEAWAVFGQGTWRPSAAVLEDRLSLTLGLRYTEEKKAIDQAYGGIISPLAPIPNGAPPPVYIGAVTYGTNGPVRTVSNDENFHNLSGTFTAAWQFTEDFNGFLRYATGYRSGGYNGELFDNGFDEETIEQWELGIKSDWWNRRLRINGSLWTYTYKDIQVSQIIVDQSGNTSTSITNAGEADRWGGELEMLVSPAEDLILGLSYSYIHGDFDKFPEVCTASSCIPGKNDAKRGASPSNQLLASADYVFARTDAVTFRGYLEVQWQDEWAESALWTGTYTIQPYPNKVDIPHIYPHQMMDERTLVNLRLSAEEIRLGDGVLKLSLWGKNLLDDDYPTFAINFGSLGPISEQYGEPLTYGLDISYEYF
ncbi:MAG: TonB-dependent receptor, partial [Spongiibacteraceae bacterium]|nr:TonB-dependent receptor [Spongiibacteraceae bacterium]